MKMVMGDATAKTANITNPVAVRVYRKYHISKNMGVVLVGMAFEDSFKKMVEKLKTISKISK